MKANTGLGTRKFIRSIHTCVDCKVDMVRENNEFLCPKCGMVQEMIDGSD